MNNLQFIVACVLAVAIFLSYQKKINNDNILDQIPDWNVPVEDISPSDNKEEPEIKSEEPTSYSEALSLAKKNNKLLFLFFDANACSWCEKMKTETLSSPKIKSILSDYVTYICNADNERSVAVQYGVQSTPSYFVVNGNGQIANKGKGYKKIDEFTRWLDKKDLKVDVDPRKPLDNCPNCR